MVTRAGVRQDDVVEGCVLKAGGAIPIFASLAQLEGRPTNPVDDIESLWYCLAFLVAQRGLPWQWEPQERLTNIKRRLFIDECAVSSNECTAWLSAEDCCSTQHCFDTADKWDVPDALHELWSYVIAGQPDGDSPGTIDYEGCLEALGGDQGR